jgi:hypothetical protein
MPSPTDASFFIQFSGAAESRLYSTLEDAPVRTDGAGEWLAVEAFVRSYGES